MLAPRKGFLGTLAGFLLLFTLDRIAKPVLDMEVQDFWKDNAHPLVRDRAASWLTAMLEWIGSFWSGVGIAFAVMFCVEMLLAWRRKRRAENTPESVPEAAASEALLASRALLRLRFSGRLEAPEEIAKENIQSWFTYWSPGARATDQNGKVLFEVPSSWAVFLTFENPVAYRQVAAQFTGARPTAWQARQTLPTVAVLTIEGGMPECEMEIITRG